MKFSANLAIALFFLFLGVFGIVLSLTFGYWESAALPLAISSLMTLTAAVEVGRGISRRRVSETSGEEKPGLTIDNGYETRRFSLVFIWAAGFTLCIYLFGFLIAIPVFTFSYLKWRRRSWLVAVVFAVAALGFVYVVFEIGLNARLFQGLVFGGH